jgi:hypothetical protein
MVTITIFNTINQLIHLSDQAPYPFNHGLSYDLFSKKKSNFLGTMVIAPILHQAHAFEVIFSLLNSSS